MPNLITFGPAIHDAYNGSYLTFGIGNNDAQAMADSWAEAMSARGVGRPATAILVTGAEINAFAAARGDEDLVSGLLHPAAGYILFPLTGLSSGSLIDFKGSTGGRWFDDIINNMTGDID